ncbi:peptidylprolyl isomerase, partial [Roseisolibacter sp. H3M3-2]|uniref:peptidylprolyl isomerase n=1 Tax=Roseisolibacter sp. H3M3-2 TaxID=3031323 RepID=UPI0023DBFCC6
PLAALLGGAVAAACGGGPRGVAPRRDPLLNPDPVVETAPDTFVVRFETTQGPFQVQFIRAWAPRGADRVYYLVRSGFYDSTRFFRVLPRFVAQWGAHGNPAVNKIWESRTFPDDPVRQANVRGTVSFATAGPNTRTTQLFVNLAGNGRLDRLGFAPVGRVIGGLSQVVDSLHSGYGEGPPRGKGPDQDKLAAQGNLYLQRDFPRLDFVLSTQVVSEARLPR